MDTVRKFLGREMKSQTLKRASQVADERSSRTSPPLNEPSKYTAGEEYRRNNECDAATQQSLPNSVQHDSIQNLNDESKGTMAGEESAVVLSSSVVQELERELVRLRESEKEKAQLGNYVKALHEEYTQLSQDNTLLRTQLLSMRRPQDPIYDDPYYSQRFAQLNETIKSWVASSFKSKKVDHDILEEDETKLLQLLQKHAPSTFWIAGSVKTIFHDPRRRLALVRHLLAIQLSKYIFTRFCFGLGSDADSLMRQIVTSSMENHTDLSEVILIREALGRGALKHTEESRKIRAKNLTTEIEEALSPLLPIKQDIRPKLSKIIDYAIDLSNSMTRERALFTCTMIPSGDVVDDVHMNVADEDQNGKVFMCTFPMFGRKIMEEGVATSVCLLKGDVELESAFVNDG